MCEEECKEGRKERRDGGSTAGNRGEEKIAYFVALFVRS
jgi:hypothetical protein